MANEKEKQLRVIRKNRTGFSIFLCAFMLGCILGIIVLGLAMMGYFIIGTKMADEYENVKYMAKIYERGENSGSGAEEFLSLSDRNFLIMDAQGNVTKAFGENTCGSRKGIAFFSLFRDGMEAYQDQNDNWLSFGEEGDRVNVNYVNMLSSVIDEWEKYKKTQNMSVNVELTTDEDPEAIFSYSEKEDDDLEYSMSEVDARLAQFSVWLSVPIKEGREHFVGKATILINSGDVIFVLVIAVCVAILLGLLLLIMISNIIKNARRQRKVIEVFLTDPVTKGHNWTWFTLKLEPVLRSRNRAGKMLAVMEIVFVNYRNFCTCHSLEEGEKILEKISDVITKALTKREACAHVAASSFAVVMECEDENSLRGRLRGLVEALENVDPTHKFAFHLGVNLIGVQRNSSGKVVRRKKLRLEEEYNNACTARATLSDSDDSRIAFFDQKLVDERRWIDQVQERQEEAVLKEEFLVYYQPKYDPKTKRLRGAEALIRWNSPDLGFVSPGKFIPIFEKNGFITEIDHYMLSHVARDQKAWLDQGLTCVPVSVNVSRAHFIESDLAEQICQIVDQAGAPHDMIEIELTESAFFDDKNAMIRTITKLKEYGFMVSMDDFGAGYSSLNSLKDMPLDVLKLDADFFRGETEGGRGEIVVSEAIRLAKNLNMHTVAEGVEDKKQVEFLAKQGCDMIQGYYFAKPMPKNEYQERLVTGISEKADETSEIMPEEPASDETKTEEPVTEETKPVEEKLMEEKPVEEKPEEEMRKDGEELEGRQGEGTEEPNH